MNAFTLVRHSAITVALLASIAVTSPAQANDPYTYGGVTLIGGAGSLAGGKPIHLPATNMVSGGPITFDGATWLASRTNSLFGWTQGYTFGNGIAPSGADPWIILNGVNTGCCYERMRLYFPNLTSGFLADFRWTDGAPTANFASTIVAAYNNADQLVGLIGFNNNARNIGVSPGYWGFTRSGNVADIAYVDFDNGSMGAHDLSWVGREINGPTLGGVPEPSLWATMILGFGLVGAMLRRRGSALVRQRGQDLVRLAQ